ncbi:GntR family transcriptional regulator [Pacificimonas flava]|uniref:GntR family transcriptional regulator n=2 Tax=Pacificimonas TaxID=1960290 RepID=A0A219B1N7_9SPHN|nr:MULTISPECIES: GntR family transcriptional regulator [Pacificimonas]MBZ6378087.1 GntR family transcriptional regulator [Pacificimonas aurantium]OWV32272.1 GntR family transcriptional regulator [Pacificimonas flava]
MKQTDRPIYLQIRDRIAAAIIDEDFGVGDALPSVRMLAGQENVNPLTVSKAYQELQMAGLVEARRGLGLFVVSGARDRLISDEKQAFLTEEWPRVRAHARRLGISLADLVDAETA